MLIFGKLHHKLTKKNALSIFHSIPIDQACCLFARGPLKLVIGEISNRQGGAHMSYPECVGTILNWAELGWAMQTQQKLTSNTR